MKTTRADAETALKSSYLYGDASFKAAGNLSANRPTAQVQTLHCNEGQTAITPIDYSRANAQTNTTLTIG